MNIMRTAFIFVLTLCAGCAASETPAPSNPPAIEWKAYGADARNTKYAPLSEINAENATKLRIAWRWSSPDNDIVKQATAGKTPYLNLFEGTPVTLDGNL